MLGVYGVHGLRRDEDDDEPSEESNDGSSFANCVFLCVYWENRY